MKCSIQGCPGQYKEKSIIHAVQHNEEVFVFKHVPAEVCSVCGDTILKPDTVRRIEFLLAREPRPGRLVPLYEYA